jgi:hypothetical protein
MRRPSIRASAAALGCVALLAAAGCGSASSTAATAPTQQQPAQQQGARGGPFSQANLSALAKELGVSTTRLQNALTASRPSGGAGGGGGGRPPTGNPRARIAAGLAKQLNLSQSKVEQALAKVMPGGPPQQGQAPPSSPGTTQS